MLRCRLEIDHWKLFATYLQKQHNVTRVRGRGSSAGSVALEVSAPREPARGASPKSGQGQRADLGFVWESAKHPARCEASGLNEVLNGPCLTMISEFATKLKAIRRDIRDEYLQPHSKPWIVGFSGGKDSTILAHLVLECLLAIPPDERKRRVFILSNDTLVESPVFQAFVNRLLDHMTENIPALRVPVEVVKTKPEVEDSFWVNLLGRGYPAPNRMFRWCTDRMKIRPTSKFIREQVSSGGEAILLLGVRRSESAQRAKSLQMHDARAEGRLSPHTDFKGCYIFTPIKDLTTTEVWATLINSKPPWGGTYNELTALYKDAIAGECPFVMSTNDAPSCGTNSARFGCWTCTVIEKDNSLESLITAGHHHLEPLSKFRRRLKEVSDNPDLRNKVRRTGS